METKEKRRENSRTSNLQIIGITNRENGEYEGEII